MGTRNPFDHNEALTNENFNTRTIVYEYKADLEDLNDHNLDVSELVEAQGWEIAMLSILEPKIALS